MTLGYIFILMCGAMKHCNVDIVKCCIMPQDRLTSSHSLDVLKYPSHPLLLIHIEARLLGCS